MVYLQDPTTNEMLAKKVADLELDFVGGNKGDNRLGREDFILFDKIINIFDPQPPAKSAIIPLALSAVMIGLFVVYFGGLYTNGSNLSSFSFWGVLFTLNYLAILAIIVAFWISINLINTLWTLLFLAPVTLFLMNMALTADNCHISGFFKSKSKKD